MFWADSDILPSSWPSTKISPEVGRSIAAIRYSSELLPDPLGPTMNANRPCSIRQLRPRSACTHRLPLRYDLWTFTTSIIRKPRRKVSSVRPQPDRVHGQKPGSPPGGIKATECSHQHREPDAQRQKRGRHAQVNARPRDELVDYRRPQSRQDTAGHTGEQAEIGTLQGDERQDVALRPAV